MGSGYEISATEFGPEYGLLTYHYKFHNVDSLKQALLQNTRMSIFQPEKSTFVTKFHETQRSCQNIMKKLNKVIHDVQLTVKEGT